MLIWIHYSAFLNIFISQNTFLMNLTNKLIIINKRTTTAIFTSYRKSKVRWLGKHFKL